MTPILGQEWYPQWQWRHNECDGVSNQQPHHCLLNGWFRRRSKKTSKLCVTGLCDGNSSVTGEFLHKGPVTRKMFPFDDVILILMCMDSTLILHWLRGNLNVNSVIIEKYVTILVRASTIFLWIPGSFPYWGDSIEAVYQWKFQTGQDVNLRCNVVPFCESCIHLVNTISVTRWIRWGLVTPYGTKGLCQCQPRFSVRFIE